MQGEFERQPYELFLVQGPKLSMLNLQNASVCSPCLKSQTGLLA